MRSRAAPVFDAGPRRPARRPNRLASHVAPPELPQPRPIARLVHRDSAWLQKTTDLLVAAGLCQIESLIPAGRSQGREHVFSQPSTTRGSPALASAVRL